MKENILNFKKFGKINMILLIIGILSLELGAAKVKQDVASKGNS